MMASRPSTTTTNTSMMQLQTNNTTQTAQEFAEEHWNRASSVLAARPSLMTPHVLTLVLKNRPPPHVVEFMLKLNPDAANVPEKGPSPLQIAVRYNASVEVIRLVIQACPLALVSTHSGYDAYMYAKIWRREESELHDLLSRPLSYWVEQEKSRKLLAVDDGTRDDASNTVTSPDTCFFPATTSPTTTRVASQDTCFFPSTTPSPTTSSRAASPKQQYQHHQALVNDEELANIKTIAASIVRAQKKQVATLSKYRQHVESSIQSSMEKNHQERLDQLKKLEEIQQKHFKAQLIALDMKEKRIMARVKKMEQRVNKTLELSKQVRQVKERRQDVELERVHRSVDSVRGSLECFSAHTSKRLELAEVRLEQESRVNDYFRNDTRLQLDQLDFRASALQGWTVGDDDDALMAPVVYATPYVVEDEEDDEEYASVVPLCPKPVYETTTGNRNKRSYPKRRSRRHLLKALNF